MDMTTDRAMVQRVEKGLLLFRFQLLYSLVSVEIVLPGDSTVAYQFLDYPEHLLRSHLVLGYEIAVLDPHAIVFYELLNIQTINHQFLEYNRAPQGPDVRRRRRRESS